VRLINQSNLADTPFLDGCEAPPQGGKRSESANAQEKWIVAKICGVCQKRFGTKKPELHKCCSEAVLKLKINQHFKKYFTPRKSFSNF